MAGKHGVKKIKVTMAKTLTFIMILSEAWSYSYTHLNTPRRARYAAQSQQYPFTVVVNRGGHEKCKDGAKDGEKQGIPESGNSNQVNADIPVNKKKHTSLEYTYSKNGG